MKLRGFFLLLAGSLVVGALSVSGQTAAPKKGWHLESPDAVFDPALPIRELPATQEGSVWLAALEETAFMRSRLGDWIPCAMYQTAPGVPLRWQVKRCCRQDDECYLTLVVEGAAGVKNAFATSWTDRGADGDLHPDFSRDEPTGSAFLTFTQNDGSTRRLWLRRARSVDELKSSVKVTKAAPLWEWDEKSVKPL